MCISRFHYGTSTAGPGVVESFVGDRLLKDTLHELEILDRKVLELDGRLADRLRPHEDLVLRLCTIPGIDFTAASIILAEVGFDMSRFLTPEQLASWAALCPGNNESGGKRVSGRTREGNADTRTGCARRVVAYEYAKVRGFCARIGIGDHSEIEFFNGPHALHVWARSISCEYTCGCANGDQPILLTSNVFHSLWFQVIHNTGCRVG